MAARNIGAVQHAPTAPIAPYVKRQRRLNFVFNDSIAAGLYKMRGWTGSVYYYWTTSNPDNDPPVGAPSMSDIVIAATLIEP